MLELKQGEITAMNAAALTFNRTMLELKLG